MATKLRPQQERFLFEYLQDFNAKEAAIRAGYSPKTAHVQGSRLLSKLLNHGQVGAAIREIREMRHGVSIVTEITLNRWLVELAKMAFSDMRSFSTWGPDGVRLISSDELGDGACVAEVSETVTKDGGSVRFKLHDKSKALELLGKHFGWSRERIEHTGRDGEPIKVEATIVNMTDEQLGQEIEKLASYVQGYSEGKEDTLRAEGRASNRVHTPG